MDPVAPKAFWVKPKVPWQQRLWARINVRSGGGCWEYSGFQSASGHCQFKMPTRSAGAHRAAYESTHGPIEDGWLVLHKCDNPPCCRPDHLYLGDAKQNAKDREDRGRGNRRIGENHGRAKLTLADVKEIRKVQDYESPASIAKRYPVGEKNIKRIIFGQTWKAAIEEPA